jgi:hypothetical protein
MATIDILLLLYNVANIRDIFIYLILFMNEQRLETRQEQKKEVVGLANLRGEFDTKYQKLLAEKAQLIAGDVYWEEADKNGWSLPIDKIIYNSNKEFVDALNSNVQELQGSISFGYLKDLISESPDTNFYYWTRLDGRLFVKGEHLAIIKFFIEKTKGNDDRHTQYLEGILQQFENYSLADEQKKEVLTMVEGYNNIWPILSFFRKENMSDYYEDEKRDLIFLGLIDEKEYSLVIWNFSIFKFKDPDEAFEAIVLAMPLDYQYFFHAFLNRIHEFESVSVELRRKLVECIIENNSIIQYSPLNYFYPNISGIIEQYRHFEVLMGLDITNFKESSIDGFALTDEQRRQVVAKHTKNKKK